MTKGTLLLAGTALAAIAKPAFAQQSAERADDIVVTGTKSGDFGEKSGIPLDRLPQSVQIISADEIIQRGATSIADVLRTVPSASIGNSRVSRYQSFSLNVRGFLLDQMRNGIRQRYYEDVDASALSNIERIEILKGPSAVLYGQSAVGGIASIITKQPTAKWAGSAAFTVGSFDQRVGTIDIGGPISSTFGIRVTGEIERSGTFVDFQDIDRDNIALTLNWRPTPGVDAHFVAEYVERRTLSNPGLPAVGTITSNGIAPIRRETFLAEPAFSPLSANSPLLQAWVSIDLGSGWTITPRAQYSELNTPFTQIRVLGVNAANPSDVRRNGRIGAEDDSYTIVQLDLTGTVKTGAITHKLLLGYEYDRERSVFIQSNFVSVPSINALNPVYLSAAQRPALTFAFNFRQRLDGHALYAQDQVSIGERLGIVIGVRHAWLSNDGFFSSDPTTFGTPDTERVEQTSIQAGATYKLGGGFSVFGGYNSGYDVENSFGGAPTVTGQRLSPETSEQYELGARFSRPGARLSIAAFEIRRRDVAGDDPDNPGFSRNFGAFRVRGIELEGELEPTKHLQLSFGYAYLDGVVSRSATASEVGGRIVDLPSHSGNIRARYLVPGTPIDVRGGVNYQGPRAAATASTVLIPEVVLADLGIGGSIGRFRADLSVNNLFDRRYFTSTGNASAVFPGDPRTIALRLGVAF
ncbi:MULTISPECIES: TonB-dependent receptor [Sphingomonas]|uniref:TonB-dependent receptor n=1 Tax=Sphingomonas TaxID=13687 RepID=UPI000834B0D9|nr:TonB-dependent siderophore receptor [Sphingomonas sp. CCH10-B3]